MAKMKKKIPFGIEQILKLALRRVAENEYKSKRALVKNKLLHKLTPTHNQQMALRMIKQRGSVSFYESLAFDWRYLGGLFARGLLEWYYDSDGQRRVRATRG